MADEVQPISLVGKEGMSYIILYICLMGCGIVSTRKSRVLMDLLRSVRYPVNLLMLFTIYYIVRGVMFMMQATFREGLYAMISRKKNFLAEYWMQK